MILYIWSNKYFAGAIINLNTNGYLHFQILKVIPCGQTRPIIPNPPTLYIQPSILLNFVTHWTHTYTLFSKPYVSETKHLVPLLEFYSHSMFWVYICFCWLTKNLEKTLFNLKKQQPLHSLMMMITCHSQINSCICSHWVCSVYNRLTSQQR